MAQEDEEEPLKYSCALNEGIGGIAAVIDNVLWLGFYMSGGIGFSNTVASAAYSEVMNEISMELIELSHRYMQG